MFLVQTSLPKVCVDVGSPVPDVIVTRNNDEEDVRPLLPPAKDAGVMSSYPVARRQLGTHR